MAWILLSSSAPKSITNVDKMSVCIRLTVEESEIILSLHMIPSLERAAAVYSILERTFGFDPSLKMTDPRYLAFSTASSLSPFILISFWKPFRLFVITFDLSGPVSSFLHCGGCIQMIYQDVSFFFLFCISENVIWKKDVGMTVHQCWHYLHGHSIPHTLISLRSC